MMNKKKNKKNYDYYMGQVAICKLLGIKPPPKDMGLIRRLVYVYKQLRQESSK